MGNVNKYNKISVVQMKKKYYSFLKIKKYFIFNVTIVISDIKFAYTYNSLVSNVIIFKNLYYYFFIIHLKYIFIL